MDIAHVELTARPEGDLLRGTIGGFELWFRVAPGGQTAQGAEPFLVVGLLAAMARAEPLRLACTLKASPRLLQGMERLQEVFSTWNRQLTRVAVTADRAPPAPPRSGSAAFFSGGVDSLYTFLERSEDLTHLIHIHGFDYRRQNRSLADAAERENRRFVEGRGRRLLVVESNFRELFEHHRIHTNLYHGAVLAGIALALGLSRTYVPSSFAWDQLIPWGSHPITDPLWSTESVEILHHGVEARRIDKLRRLGGDEGALALLRVCPANTVYSCGDCEKCLRTRVALRLLGLRSPRLPPLDDLRSVRRLRIDSEAYRLAWQQNLEDAVLARDLPLAKAIAVPLARFDMRRGIRSFDRAYLGGGLRRLRGLLQRVAGRAAAREEPTGPAPPDVARV